MPATPEGTGGWTRVRRAVVKQRRVRFLLEPALAAVDRDAEGAGPAESPIWLCSDGWPPAALPTGAPRPGELKELEEHIAGARRQLRQALLRREQLLTQLRGGARTDHFTCSRPTRKRLGPPRDASTC